MSKTFENLFEEARLADDKRKQFAALFAKLRAEHDAALEPVIKVQIVPRSEPDGGIPYTGPPPEIPHINPTLVNLERDLKTFTWPVVKKAAERSANAFVRKAQEAARIELSTEVECLVYRKLRVRLNTYRLDQLAEKWDRLSLLHAVQAAIRIATAEPSSHDDILDYIERLLEAASSSAEKRK